MSAYRGVRIADFSQGVAGPMAAMLLGDFEAEVVKVEPPGGDRMKDHPGYLAWNRNKQVVSLDLETPEGLAAAKALIAGADVALFDHAPGRLEALGLDGATLTAAHPALVHAWMPPYGTAGAWSDLPAHHSLLAGLTGVAFRQGAWEDKPIHLVLPIAWYSQAVLGAGAIGAALYERGRSGRGQALTVSGLHGSAEAAPPSLILGEAPLPRGTPPGSNPRYRLYQCADREWFFLGTLFTNFYRKVFQVLDLEDAFDALEADMLAARDLLEGMFLSRTRDEWLEALRANDVPCAPIGRREAWFAGAAVAEGGLRTVLAHPTLGDVAMPAPSTRFSATPASIRSLPQAAVAPAWPAKTALAGSPVGGQPLAGVRVLNLGTVIAGAYAGSILAQLGAEVTKIEPREADPFRSDGSQFLAYNRGVRGLGLNLKTPEARALFLEMVATADVVIDNYRLGVRGRLGIDYAALKAANPRIISCSINAYGESGPRAALPGFDPLLQAEGGMMAAQGGDGDPILHTIAVNDIATAATVAGAVITALNARERTGEGQEVLTSLMAQSLLFQLGEMVTYGGRPANDLGGVDCLGVSALHRYYACADGWIGLVAETEAAALAVGRVLGIDLGSEPLAAARDSDLAGRIEATLAERLRAEILVALRSAGVAAAPVIRGGEALDDPWLAENGFVEGWDHPRLGPMITARSYATFSRTPSGFSHPTPDLAEHSAAILSAYGIAPERIAALMAVGAVF
ncbi:MAG: CoA transferase [Alphaproteobacteria bacterium]|nr:CoA transferase [Alphaproteobacteria bacterium]MBU1513815.1 CoA transferase [Alphaproteobacteria bacterium]MBU2094540.1 CoA transferase [Alphaproteobacteria bacterium]MBU2151260.1 CoA transferase [Alphaproteobacteria bacterium]MBU2305535.1 CoA transferase [Alphaproteobacteria bacterium]